MDEDDKYYKHELMTLYKTYLDLLNESMSEVHNAEIEEDFNNTVFETNIYLEEAKCELCDYVNKFYIIIKNLRTKYSEEILTICKGS